MKLFATVLFLVVSLVFGQEPFSLEAKIAEVAKREATAREKLDMAEAACKAARQTKAADDRPFICDPFAERVEWFDASRELLWLKSAKIKRDSDAVKADYDAKMAESNRKIAEAKAKFCQSADRALLDEELDANTRKVLTELRRDLCSKKQ